MKALILDKNGKSNIINIDCKNGDLEVSSWKYIGDCISSVAINNSAQIKCIFNDAFGYDIYDNDVLMSYENVHVRKLFNLNFPVFNTVVIVGIRNGKNCDIRKRDVEYIEGIIKNGKTF